MRPYSQNSISLKKIADSVGASATLSDTDLAKILVTGITHTDSAIEVGDLFIALEGANRHGAEFAASAQKKGAVAVLTDASGLAKITGIPVLVVANPRAVAGEIAALFYNEPMRDLASIGITGTNGKTTVTTLLYQIFESAHRSCGLIGTIETRMSRDILASSRTTPEATDLQALAAAMREQHMRHLVMEVSSHAMTLHRMRGAHFDYVGFTNLTQDHLDFHTSMENYFAAKAALFTYTFADNAVINIDDEFGRLLAASTELPVISLSRMNPQAAWHYIEIDVFGKQIGLKVRGPGGILIETTTTLRGGYNFDNLLMAIAMAVESGIDPIEIAMIVPTLQGAAGRLEEVKIGQPFSAIVDYAHTPDAVANALQAIREFTTGKIIAVLGCGGDRDVAKRALMGRALKHGSDVAIFTSDNPRSEDPLLILKTMVGEQSVTEPSRVIADRRTAIKYAVAIATPGDTVAILGKGHELGQEILGVIAEFDDRVVLAQAIAGTS